MTSISVKHQKYGCVEKPDEMENVRVFGTKNVNSDCSMNARVKKILKCYTD